MSLLLFYLSPPSYAVTGYSITINGIDRTAEFLTGSITIEDIINDQANTCGFSIMDRTAAGLPENGDEIVITVNGDKYFGGIITKVTKHKQDYGVVVADCEAVDYTWLLDQNLVHKSYEDMTDAEIIEDIINVYAPSAGITTVNVLTGATLSQKSFNYIQPSQAFRQLAELTGRNWYIDYDKDIHFFPLSTSSAPFDLNNASNIYYELSITKDFSQLRNRVYVRGGTYLSDFVIHEQKGDGVKRQFLLPDKPHDVSVTVNGVAKTVGIKNVDTFGFDYYLNFQEKYIEQDDGVTELSDTDTLAVTYKYDIPILVAQEDSASIMDNGQREFAIFDKSITTVDAARTRALAELTDYANNLVEASFKTMQLGFRSGQTMNINLTAYDINDDYIIQSVVAKGIGAGYYEFEVKLASAKTMGIIKFLIELLEANKNLIELDDSEVVDELFPLTDSLLSDSLLDSLVIDSAGAFATWCTSSELTPSTRAVWDLFQWG